MRDRMRKTWVPFLCLVASPACAQEVSECPPPEGVAMQVLGSGGPVADDGRASSAYVIWVDGRSRVLIDAGGGAFLRFGEAGAEFRELDFIGLSHFHADHSADFVALLKSGFFSRRERPLVAAGPGSGGPFPAFGAFLRSLIDRESGAYGYLSGYLDGSGRLVKLDAREVAREQPIPLEVYNGGNQLLIEALPVPHGIVPALGFRVRVAETIVVFASDQNGSDERFTTFAKDANLLIMHMAVPEDATGSALQLHAKPSRIGEIAAASGADTLLLSHFMARSLRGLESNVAVVRESYDGKVIIAEDLACLTLTAN